MFTFSDRGHGIAEVARHSRHRRRVAMADVTSGEVVITLPTQAAMDHAGEGNPLRLPIGTKAPVAGRWQLPAMAAGERWKQRMTLPAMDKGYYQIALNADMAGSRQAYMADDVYRQVWIFISDDGAQLTEVFDASVFPAGERPVPGPIRARRTGPRRRRPCCREGESRGARCGPR